MIIQLTFEIHKDHKADVIDTSSEHDEDHNDNEDDTLKDDTLKIGFRAV